MIHDPLIHRGSPFLMELDGPGVNLNLLGLGQLLGFHQLPVEVLDRNTCWEGHNLRAAVEEVRIEHC